MVSLISCLSLYQGLRPARLESYRITFHHIFLTFHRFSQLHISSGKGSCAASLLFREIHDVFFKLLQLRGCFIFIHTLILIHKPHWGGISLSFVFGGIWVNQRRLEWALCGTIDCIETKWGLFELSFEDTNYICCSLERGSLSMVLLYLNPSGVVESRR